jgi:hypothetical protein
LVLKGLDDVKSLSVKLAEKYRQGITLVPGRA